MHLTGHPLLALPGQHPPTPCTVLKGTRQGLAGLLCSTREWRGGAPGKACPRLAPHPQVQAAPMQQSPASRIRRGLNVLPPPQGGSSAQARLGRGIPKPQTSSQRSLGGGLLGSVPFPMRPRGPHFESTFHTELPTTLSISPNPDATSSCPAWASSSNLPPAPCLLPARNQDPWPFCLHSRLLRACYPALPSPLTTLCPKQV